MKETQNAAAIHKGKETDKQDDRNNLSTAEPTGELAPEGSPISTSEPEYLGTTGRELLKRTRNGKRSKFLLQMPLNTTLLVYTIPDANSSFYQGTCIGKLYLFIFTDQARLASPKALKLLFPLSIATALLIAFL